MEARRDNVTRVGDPNRTVSICLTSISVLLPENLHAYFELSAQAGILYKAPQWNARLQLLPGANKVVNALRLRSKAFICRAGSEKMDSVVKTLTWF